MIQKYTFFDGGTVEFENSKSVGELIKHAFDVFDYYEPLGMQIMTVFQHHHPNSNTGWFTTDTSRSCAEEIVSPDELCFAYHLPGVFYFAEGGWGHHMRTLGNHPELENPIALNLRFEDFDNTVVFNGSRRFLDIIQLLRGAGYISPAASTLAISVLDPPYPTYRIPFSDPILNAPLYVFQKNFSQLVTIICIE